ncbi:MAG: Holliday junction branch migration protein RuvA [Candidatus Dadabacteria bacterium]|nr:MAG: Holliday junction branch migration protein RuvA [Candidatus Dadabacteria bacterium]
MISMLRGKVSELNGNAITVDIGGVGYDVICSSACLEKARPGSNVELTVYTDVRPESIQLFGFADRLEKQVFLLLIKVKGVGARSALEIISNVEKKELLRIIGTGEAARLQRVKGIGKKTAERIIVELKDRVVEYVKESSPLAAGIEREVSSAANDALEALCALGFARREAENALQAAIDSGNGLGSDSGELLKAALRYI